MTGVSFTVDLEDHRAHARLPIRYERVMREIVLPMLDGLGARATVFVVGTVARRSPRLVADIAAAGHELGLHAWDHEALDTIDADGLRDAVRRGIGVLGDITGAAPAGYRAASFSLTAASAAMASDVLRDHFEYSSSVLPARNPLHGFPGAPLVPFRYPSGLLELPAPLVTVPGGHVPLGGTYLRVLPSRLLGRAVDEVARHPAPWVYCHPYDFDPGEAFWWEPVAGPMAPLLWVGRRRSRTRIEQVLDGRLGPPLGEVAAGLVGADLPSLDV